ncbi:e18df67f-5a13-4ad2-8edd-cdb43e6eaa11 [Thermothielavioides terrestris]|jgi:hypothetical protein|uniref:Mediator of RNA polymerase II transcription subunit 4 n=2 Tax=Thermothielavioides terrestris TaxID=2587410 RepID=G2RD15_THETT|nr:uncharacterized protein THITE_2122400 [Thermothielavioides terrestris NRRL 8126]AEO70708.1 hypothetical protein THITE_2122400 [Thermothielavioides terrestris NRRL 8126]SPQ25323.1 e18df67f-5a13-4ad2-8edd-cdb43e6eaa11 [Thermothielavioides terrestris]
MEDDLARRIERVEKAVAAVVDSIANNNPSVQLAEELAAAQDDLDRGLKLFEVHQNNYARILKLREEVSQNDAKIKDVINALWSIRKELTSIPTTSQPPPGSKYSYTTDELLTYARLISRNTLPLPGVANNVAPSSTQPSKPEDTSQLQTPSQTGPTPNASFNQSFATAAASTPGPMSASTPNTTQQTSQITSPFQTKKPTTEFRIPDFLKPAVNPLHGATFQPWPTQEQIRSGGLAAVQALVDRGIDPRGYDPEEEERKRKAEEQAKKEAEEQARREREEAERRMREERERMARERERARQMEAAAGGGGLERRDSVAVGRVNKPKQFTFLGADDDDDDEDD